MRYLLISMALAPLLFLPEKMLARDKCPQTTCCYSALPCVATPVSPCEVCRENTCHDPAAYCAAPAASCCEEPAVSTTPDIVIPPLPKQPPAQESPLCPPEETTPPPREVRPYVSAIQTAPDVKSVLEAFREGSRVAPRDSHLLEAYLHRMYRFNMAENAYLEAQLLVNLDPRNGFAWAMVAYSNGVKGNLYDGMAAITNALADAPCNPAVQRVAGQMYAWYDRNTKPLNRLQPELVAQVEQHREDVIGRPSFDAGYAAVAAGNNPFVPANPAMAIAGPTAAGPTLAMPGPPAMAKPLTAVPPQMGNRSPAAETAQEKEVPRTNANIYPSLFPKAPGGNQHGPTTGASGR